MYNHLINTNYNYNIIIRIYIIILTVGVSLSVTGNTVHPLNIDCVDTSNNNF